MSGVLIGVLLCAGSALFFLVVAWTSFVAWLEAEPFEGPNNTPRAAVALVLGVSVVSQALVMAAVAYVRSHIVVRALVIATGAAVMAVHCVFLRSEFTRWQELGTSTRFWSGDTSSFWVSLTVSIMAPPVFYLVARATRR